jgi:hypothetical protein
MPAHLPGLFPLKISQNSEQIASGGRGDRPIGRLPCYFGLLLRSNDFRHEHCLNDPAGKRRNAWMKRIILCLGIFGSLIELASARDLGQWDAANPEIREWYQALMQPDVPNASCCGEADAYWADEVHVRDGKTYAIITDERSDAPRGRPHVDIGTEIEIPNNKLKWDKSNPTGHGIVFLSRGGYVFCYVQPGGA